MTDSLADFRPDDGEHLETGWGSHTPPGDSVVRDHLDTLAARLLATAALTGGRSRRTDDAVFVDCRSAYVFDNVAICAGPLGGGALDRVAAEADEFFAGSPLGWTLIGFDHRADLRPHGLELLGHPPLMFRPRGGTAPPTPEGLDVVPVTDDRTLADFEETLVEAYPLPRGAAVMDPRALAGESSAWVGYLDEGPVATAGSFTGAGLTEIEWVSTRESARGRGVGAALTWAALSVDRDADAALIATDAGQPVYRRLGFVPLLRLTMWLHA